MPLAADTNCREHSECRVVVLVPHRAPPVVFRATPSQLVSQTQAVLADTLRLPTLPFYPRPPTFAENWKSLCVDLLDAQHFESVHAARAHYRLNGSALHVNVRSSILAALERLHG
jgi:hypothetical protein